MTPADHRAAQEALETLANRELLAVWRTLDPSDAREFTLLLMPVMRDLTVSFAEVSATLAAEFYDDARAAAGVPDRVRARPAAPAPGEQIDALTRWAVTPMFSGDPRQGTALVNLAGGYQRLIRRAERDTIFNTGRQDQALATWVRVPRADACDFCLMLGSRTDVYDSRDSASQVVGREVRRWDRPGRRGTSRIVDRVGGRRGSRHLGESFHDNCRCETRPVWSPADVPDINRQLQDEWNDVTAGQPDQIAAWRAHIAETRPNQHTVRP